MSWMTREDYRLQDQQSFEVARPAIAGQAIIRGLGQLEMVGGPGTGNA